MIQIVNRFQLSSVLCYGPTPKGLRAKFEILSRHSSQALAKQKWCFLSAQFSGLKVRSQTRGDPTSKSGRAELQQGSMAKTEAPFDFKIDISAPKINKGGGLKEILHLQSFNFFRELKWSASAVAKMVLYIGSEPNVFQS